MVVISFVKPDNSTIPSTSRGILGFGKTGVVLRHGEHALKIARLEDVASVPDEERFVWETLNEMNHDALHNEIEIYEQLGSHPGIIKIFKLSRESIEMAYVRGGSLVDFIEKTSEVTDLLKAKWIWSIVCTLSHVHKHGVAVEDIALRNFLIDEDLAIKLIDFGLSTRQQVGDVPMEITAAQTDIFRIGFIIYSIAAWKIYDHDEFEYEEGSGHDGGSVPGQARPKLPSVNHFIGGSIINRCWTGGYKSVNELCDDVWRGFDAWLS